MSIGKFGGELGGINPTRPNELGSSVQPYSDRSFQPSQRRQDLTGERFALPRLQEGTSGQTPDSLSPLQQPQPAQPEPQQSQFSPIAEIPKAVPYHQIFPGVGEYWEQQQQKTALALTPERELTSQTEWRQWLESNIEEFAGNLDNAATLMAALTEGKNYNYEKLTSRRSLLTSFVRPHTFIFLEDMPDPIFEKLKIVIGVNRSYLEEKSNMDMQEMVTMMAYGSVTHHGTIPDFFRLSGYEELDHAADHQRKKRKAILPGFNIFNIRTLAEYDAQEHEYRSLKGRVRYAEEIFAEGKMPIETVNVLRDRLAAAKSVRNQTENSKWENAQDGFHTSLEKALDIVNSKGNQEQQDDVSAIILHISRYHEQLEDFRKGLRTIEQHSFYSPEKLQVAISMGRKLIAEILLDIRRGK